MKEFINKYWTLLTDLCAKHGTEFMAFLILFLAPITDALYATGILIICDTLTGVWAAVSKGGWPAFISSKFKRVVPKLILYTLVIIVALIAEKLSPEVPYVRVATGLLAAVEVKSIYENASTILGFDIWNKFQDAMIKLKKDDK